MRRPVKNVRSVLLTSSDGIFFAVRGVNAAPSKASSIQMPFCVANGKRPTANGRSNELG